MNRLKKIKQGIVCELFVIMVAISFVINRNLTEDTLTTLYTSMTTNSEEGNEEESTNSRDSSENEEADSNENSDSAEDTQEKKDYVKWVEFDVTYEAMDQAYQYDVESYGEEVKINWIDLLAYLGARYGGDFSRYKKSDMTKLVERLKSKEETMESITADMKYYSYFREVYEAVLGGLVGEYEIQEQAEGDSGEAAWVKKYGLKAYLPIAKFFPYNDYDDFGVSRSYGYKRRHLGHDMMGQVGTPIVAVESGYVEALGWNQYGGWRIGIRSFDGKRYYYYAHLRKNFPYNKSLVVGSIVQAGDVIGYLGRTGYSKHENVNNIDTAHLHFGLQLIFDESQKEGTNEIWIDCYNLVKFLYKNRCETSKNEETKEWYRLYDIKDPTAQEYIVNHPDAPVIEEAPGQKVTVPEENAITPGCSSTTPEKNTTTPSDSNTTPGDSSTTPEKNTTTSEENTTLQEQGN